MSTNPYLQYCPRCGCSHFKTGDFKPWSCPDCNFQFFQNIAASAAALILNDKDELLLVRRAHEPQRGMWHLPGGFIDAGETAEQAVARECMEEVNLELSHLQYLQGFPNTYRFDGLTYNTLDIFFEARTCSADSAKAMDEVDGICWAPLNAIDLKEVGFVSCRNAISMLAAKYEQKPEMVSRPRPSTGNTGN